MTRKYFYSNRLRHAIPFAAASFTVGLALFACSDKDIDSNENNGKALVAFNVLEKQDQAQAAAKSNQPVTRAAFASQLALQDLAPEDLTMQKLPVQGMASQGLCLIETTVPGVPSQKSVEAQTRANITTMPTMQNFSTTASYGYSDTSLTPWFYDKDTNKDGNLVAPIYWDWIKNHACFYAVYPKPDNNKIKLSPASHTGTPYVNFEVEPNVTNQKDLMTACSGNVHLDAMGTAPRTDLTFRHALTAVRFKVGQNLSYSKHITKVEIVNALSKGKYVLPTDKNHTGAWDASTLSAPATFTLGGDGTVSVSTSEAVNNIIMGHNQDNYVFYMIPQPLTGVQVKVYFDNAPTPAITANLAGTWKPGTTKTYALSQNTSTWLYELTATPPAPAAYNANATGNYKIESYREDPVSHTKQAVPWEVVGYDADNDGTFSMSEKPAWLTGLTKENGEGSTAPSGETGQATLKLDIVDKLAPRNNALKSATPLGSASNHYDLSTYDYKGNSTNRNTANCYLISAPGYYKIPLVYGNAITNGATNTNAYISQAPTGTWYESYILRHFKDHDNKDITNPWITQSNGGANVPNGAKLVWADESGLVTNLAVTGSGTNAFVQFEVPADKIKSGNAVIAVTKNNVVVWSWHLWFAPQDVLNTTACTNFQNHVYKYTKEPLGWKYTAWKSTTYSAPRSVMVKVEQTQGQESGKQVGYITITQNNYNVRQGYVTFYQFGRKDALPGTDAIAEGSYSFDNTTGGHSIGDAIQHPENMFGYAWGGSGTHRYNWCNASYFNIWSMVSAINSFNDDAVVKTIYDPCPAGFHLPASNSFTGFSTTGTLTYMPSEINKNGAWDNGWHFNNKISNPDATVWFPASGLRNYDDGLLRDVDTQGNYWSAVTYGEGFACWQSFRQGYVNPQDYIYCSFGCAVRPVADN